MSNVAQTTVSGFAAAAVTLGLFSIMNSLVSNNYNLPTDEPIPKIPVVVGEVKIVKTIPRELPKPVEMTDKPPQIVEPLTTNDPTTLTNTFTLIHPVKPTGVDIAGPAMDGSIIPLVKVQPNYPSRAINQGITGHCTVSYTVTAVGTTANIAVDKSDCTHSAFHKSSIAAAAKFKYQPRIVNGEAIQTQGVRNRFTYQLD